MQAERLKFPIQKSILNIIIFCDNKKGKADKPILVFFLRQVTCCWLFVVTITMKGTRKKSFYFQKGSTKFT